MSFKSMIQDMKGELGSISRKSFDVKFGMRSRSQRVVQDTSFRVDALKQSCWANMPPELLRDVLMRIEASDDTWPPRKNVVCCAGVCRNWREIMKEIVKSPEVSGKLTFPISLKQSGPRNTLLQCYIKRSRSNQTYYLFLGLSQASTDDGKFLLAAKKCRRPTCTDYIISLNAKDVSKGNSAFVGKLRSNFLGTKFTIYDVQPTNSGAKVTKCRSTRLVNKVSPRVPAGNYPVAHIAYELNVMGARGPRRMHCVMDSIPARAVEPGGVAPTQTEFLHSNLDSFPSVPFFRSTSTRTENFPSPLESGENEGMLALRNKAPRWHEQLQCWCLNFNGRVTVASVKNFQLVSSSENGVAGQEHENVILQFGKVGKDVFTMDYQYPISAFQAFAGVCKSENEISAEGGLNSSVFPVLPSDSELAAAFVDRKRREGSLRGFGVRVSQSAEGSDSWVDDPITRHIIGIYISNEEGGDDNLLWPLILHTKGHYCILVLPMVEPRHLKAFVKLCNRSDCGNAVGVEDSISTILLDLPSITGAFMVAHAIGDIITGDVAEPEVVVSASPSVGGLLDSLTGSIGISSISSRAKPVAAPVASSTPSGIAATGTVTSDAHKTGSRPLDKDALRTFISSSMPFGTPLDLSFPNIVSIRVNGFSSSDLPPADLKQPAWKPYLYKGRQRILFSVHETVHAALYDRDEIPDSISISGQINCRAELEGLPDVTFPLIGLNADHIEVLSFHPCVQVPEQGSDKQAVIFSPPLGNFVLMRYQAVCGLGPPIKGFYQLSMVSEDKGDFLFKLRLLDGYKSPLAMEFCTVTMPFPTRRVVSFDGTPSVGMVSATDHSVEWKIVMGGRGLTKSIEATFPGKVQFAPWKPQKSPTSSSAFGSIADEDSDIETDGNNNNMVNVDEFLTEKMSKDLHPADLEEPFCWHAYNYAKVSFKIVGASLSGMSSDPKSVSIYPTVKAPVEFSTQVTSGDYILWNTLGRCPSVAVAKV